MLLRSVMLKPRRSARSGVAAVEFAVVLPLLLILMLGVWELGRMVEVQQILVNACREGGRQASTGKKTIAQVKQDVVNYLQRNGITAVTTSDVTIENLTSAARLEPALSEQLDHYKVSVSVPVESIRWILLPRLSSADRIGATADWYAMKDIPITINDQIPLE